MSTLQVANLYFQSASDRIQYQGSDQTSLFVGNSAVLTIAANGFSGNVVSTVITANGVQTNNITVAEL